MDSSRKEAIVSEVVSSPMAWVIRCEGPQKPNSGAGYDVDTVMIETAESNP